MQTFADGSVYKYSYDVSQDSLRTALMNTPDGKTYHIKLYEDSSTTWERSAPRKPATLTADVATLRGRTE